MQILAVRPLRKVRRNSGKRFRVHLGCNLLRPERANLRKIGQFGGRCAGEYLERGIGGGHLVPRQTGPRPETGREARAREKEAEAMSRGERGEEGLDTTRTPAAAQRRDQRGV